MTSTATSSPFQILNNSARKYDSLRGKYISAYIESLRLCNRRTELEQFMKSLSSSKRDLPNYFQASALIGGSAPAKSHTNESLLQTDESLMSSGFLLSAKRQGNSAIADFILKSLSDEDAGGKKTAENNLKQAYACYLRLHCSEEDLKKTRAMKYGVATIREVEALCNAYLNTDYSKTSSTACNDWSGGARKSSIFNAAVEKCPSLFPTLSGKFLFKNLKKSKEKDAGGTLSGSKRKNSRATRLLDQQNQTRCLTNNSTLTIFFFLIVLLLFHWRRNLRSRHCVICRFVHGVLCLFLRLSLMCASTGNLVAVSSARFRYSLTFTPASTTFLCWNVSVEK
jgi:hypothetical protein